MAKKYGHLSLAERERMYALSVSGKSVREIGRILGRDHTSLSRELKRNALYGQEYLPVTAERRAIRRRAKQRYKAPLKCPLVWLYVRERLRLGWSPETIAGRLVIDHPSYSIDDETIYRYIYKKTRLREKLYEYLTHHRKKRMRKFGRKVKKGRKIKDAVYIDSRPQSINQRVSFGHWETDNMEGVKSDKGVISATVERMSRLIILSKLVSHTSRVKTEAVVDRLSRFPKKVVKTITTDNGAENSNHKYITTELKANVYFCHPYHSWEKGTVENSIGRLRRFLPKGESVRSVTEDELIQIEHLMNNTPRKCLGYKTPYEKFSEYVRSFRVYSKHPSGALPVRM